MKKFTFTFTGAHDDEIAERFKAAYWDGGGDMQFEQDFLQQYNLNLDDTEFDGAGDVIVHTDNATV
jgi:hypothetical protein